MIRGKDAVFMCVCVYRDVITRTTIEKITTVLTIPIAIPVTTAITITTILTIPIEITVTIT